ncbi:MAG: DNA-binding transcriptional LysR family regulator [Alteromonadaceae bacterium]|jgi:DNA-binding transcriptional LysR family regulator
MLHDSFPKLCLVLDGDTISNIEKLLLKDKAHIALLPGYQQTEGLFYEPIYSEPIYLCCSKQHEFLIW